MVFVVFNEAYLLIFVFKFVSHLHFGLDSIYSIASIVSVICDDIFTGQFAVGLLVCLVVVDEVEERLLFDDSGAEVDLEVLT